MSLPVAFKPAALAEFEEAIAWYETQRPGLGEEFKWEVKATLKRALRHPGLCQKVRGCAQRIRLRRFKKYAIYFAIKDGTFAVIAIFHGSRNPAELQPRLR